MARCSSTSASSASNALLQQDGLPRFDEFEAGQVKPAVEVCLSQLEKDFSTLEKQLGEGSTEKTYEEVVEAMERAEAPLEYSWGMVSHLMGVKNSDELRSVYQEMQPPVIRLTQKLSQSAAVYNALKALDKSKLDGAQQRIVESSMLGMELSGIGLEGEQREEFNKLQLRAAELSTTFANNVIDASNAFKLTLTDAAEVEGLPESALDLMAQNAVAEGHQEATPKDGPWTVTLDQPTFIAFMKDAKDSQLREKVYKAYITRASDGDWNNLPLIDEILSIRATTSAMLGYPCYSEQSLKSKMADSPAKVLELTAFMRDRAKKYAERELQELQEFANENGLDGKLKNSDIAFWSERLKESRFNFSPEEVRPYFSLEAVLNGLFTFAERLFAVTIKPADGSTSVWDKDVRFFEVRDTSTGNHIASFYLDPFARSAEKRPGAWMAPCQGRSRVLGRIPVAYLVCNGSPPTADKPSLLTFNDVETLWHEMGHGLQHMLTEVEHAPAAGINNVEWDAVELPSQFMEEWLYDKPTLLSFARHYETGEPLPDDLFDKLYASRHFMSGMFMMRQLSFGALDIKLHSKEFDPLKVTPLELQHENAKEFSILPPLAEDRFLCSFQHIFAGGYASGYYSYLWARIMSSDAFAAFEEVGLDNDEKIKELGLKFRKTVLAQGGGAPPAKVFFEFRGGEPNPEPLLRHSGLAEASNGSTAQSKL